jgi:N-acetylglucosamine-6-phosphate deacetylase
MHTLAPERPGGIAAVRRLAEAGVLVSIGHSDATAAQAEAATDAGARLVTHLFNAMRPLHHREPGLVGQALADPRLTSGLIADLHHVAAPVCRLAFAAAPGRIMLVTDAVAAAGMPPGTYDLGGQQVSVDPLGLPRRADGTIAGSGLRLDAAIAFVVTAGIDLRTAVDAATRLPADVIGRPDLGRIAPGALADLVWLGDDLTARATWLGGRLAYGQLPGAGDGAVAGVVDGAVEPAADRVRP